MRHVEQCNVEYILQMCLITLVCSAVKTVMSMLSVPAPQNTSWQMNQNRVGRNLVAASRQCQIKFANYNIIKLTFNIQPALFCTLYFLFIVKRVMKSRCELCNFPTELLTRNYSQKRGMIRAMNDATASRMSFLSRINPTTTLKIKKKEKLKNFTLKFERGFMSYKQKICFKVQVKSPETCPHLNLQHFKFAMCF